MSLLGSRDVNVKCVFFSFFYLRTVYDFICVKTLHFSVFFYLCVLVCICPILFFFFSVFSYLSVVCQLYSFLVLYGLIINIFLCSCEPSLVHFPLIFLSFKFCLTK